LQLELARKQMQNNRAHQVPLSAPVVAILESLKSYKIVVFEPVSFSRMKGELDKLLPANMPKWTLHDLRRSAASGLAALGTAPHVVEKILNHQSGSIRGVAAIYNRHSYSAEKREALTKWAQHVVALPAPFVAPTKAA
jgi:integrase